MMDVWLPVAVCEVEKCRFICWRLVCFTKHLVALESGFCPAMYYLYWQRWNAEPALSVHTSLPEIRAYLFFLLSFALLVLLVSGLLQFPTPVNQITWRSSESNTLSQSYSRPLSLPPRSLTGWCGVHLSDRLKLEQHRKLSWICMPLLWLSASKHPK